LVVQEGEGIYLLHQCGIYGKKIGKMAIASEGGFEQEWGG